ncbi:hypothetical protein, partial [Xanthomonas hortorum]|uniref:hypothetical protein n=1 Tax=Xanthomonas hortorum TaxID=56454 RepID=UPI001B86F313
PAGLLALAQAFSVAERQLHGLLLNMRRVVSRIYGALFRGSLDAFKRCRSKAWSVERAVPSPLAGHAASTSM